jgi:hypothetical protein
VRRAQAGLLANLPRYELASELVFGGQHVVRVTAGPAALKTYVCSDRLATLSEVAGTVGWTKWAVCVVAGAASAILSACVAYDHRWLQAQQEKQRAAKRLEPAKLRRQGDGSRQRRSASVRAYATRAYAAETLHWERQFAELLSGANEILEPAVGLRLESSGATLWQPKASEDRLAGVLDELAEHDRGDGVDWVVGFVKSTPELVFDQHQLGVGRILSKYLVVRASNDPRELELLSHQYYSLSDADKAKLHTDRRRHRWIAVFLHEIGHTLGARHRVAKNTIMNPTYDPEHQGFDETTLGLLRITVAADRGSPPVDVYRDVRAYYEAQREGWVASEREHMLTWLAPLARSQGRGAPGAASGSAPAAAVPLASEPVEATPLPLTTLNPQDLGRYENASEAEKKGQFREAWQTLLPIIEAHGRVIEVQELRCRLAKQQRFFASVEDAHCAPVASLRGAANP